MTYGTTLRLQGELLTSSASTNGTEFVENLKNLMSKLQATPTSNHSTQRHGKPIAISIDRLKPAYVAAHTPEEPMPNEATQ